MRLAVSDVVGQTGGVAVRGVLREVGGRLRKAPRDEGLMDLNADIEGKCQSCGGTEGWIWVVVGGGPVGHRRGMMERLCRPCRVMFWWAIR